MADSRAEVVVDRLWTLYSESYSPFPSENIGVEDGQDTTIKSGDSSEEYRRETYGRQNAFECLVRTILSQNTSDKASQPAHDALMERYGEPDGEARRASPSGAKQGGTRDAGRDELSRASARGARGDADLAAALANADTAELADTIRPAGLYNRKAEVLIAVAERVLDAHGSAAAFDRFVREGDPAEVRSALLDLDGVGPKTADCVLLFSGGRAGVFPVDTHVHRIYRRLGIAPPTADHEGVRAVLERDVPGEKCGFGHTATIQFGREYCTARSPACLDGPDACPLYDLCDRVGVDPESGEVVDPAETVSQS